MFKLVVISLLISSVSFSIQAQEKVTDVRIYEHPDQLVARLATGAILVRLNTAEKQLELLEKMNLTQKAQQLKDNLESENKEIRIAFREKLTYIKSVYFFMSYDSPKVKLGDFEGYLMDVNGNLVSFEPNTFDAYVIAEFAKTEQLGIPALVVYDNQFNQLAPPFPYFVRTFESLPLIGRTHKRTVELFNEQLEFYSEFRLD